MCPASYNFGSTAFVPRASRLLFCELRITPEASLSQDAIPCERKKADLKVSLNIFYITHTFKTAYKTLYPSIRS